MSPCRDCGAKRANAAAAFARAAAALGILVYARWLSNSAIHLPKCYSVAHAEASVPCVETTLEKLILLLSADPTHVLVLLLLTLFFLGGLNCLTTAVSW